MKLRYNGNSQGVKGKIAVPKVTGSTPVGRTIYFLLKLLLQTPLYRALMSACALVILKINESFCTTHFDNLRHTLSQCDTKSSRIFL